MRLCNTVADTNTVVEVVYLIAAMAPAPAPTIFLTYFRKKSTILKMQFEIWFIILLFLMR
jgi:hypothetical protein